MLCRSRSDRGQLSATCAMLGSVYVPCPPPPHLTNEAGGGDVLAKFWKPKKKKKAASANPCHENKWKRFCARVLPETLSPGYRSFPSERCASSALESCHDCSSALPVAISGEGLVGRSRSSGRFVPTFYPISVKNENTGYQVPGGR